MPEKDKYSQEYQNTFRASLERFSPRILDTVQILEANGLVVVGYSLVPSGDIVLDVGLPPKDNEQFEEAFTLRVHPNTYPLKWEFGAVAYPAKLSPEIRRRILFGD